MTRREAREAAFCLIFEKSFKGDDSGDTLIANAAEARELKINEFGKGLFEGTVAKFEEIDPYIDEALISWKKDRVSRVAYAAMRLCTYELLHSEIDSEIAINEAIELIKKFDSPEAASYANGVLATVNKKIKTVKE